MDETERTATILEAHREMVEHIEKGARRIWFLSIITMAVAALLAVSYAFQLILPLTGTTSVTVNLVDPANLGSEAIVLLLVLAWLYVGVRDFRFSARMRREIGRARSLESRQAAEAETKEPTRDS